MLEITKEDVGRKVVDGNGDVETIGAWWEGKEYPVETDIAYYTSDGYHGWRSSSKYDLVAFVDKKTSHDTSLQTALEASLSRVVEGAAAIKTKLNSIEVGGVNSTTLGIKATLSPDTDQVCLGEDYLDRTDVITYLKEMIKILES